MTDSGTAEDEVIHPGYPYPVQLDLQGHRVTTFDFLGLPVFLQQEQMRIFRERDTEELSGGEDQ